MSRRSPTLFHFDLSNVRRDPAYHLNGTPTPLPIYQLKNSNPLRDQLLFVSPPQARKWIISLLAAYRYADADRLITRVWYSFSHTRYAALRRQYWEKHRAEVEKQLARLLQQFAFNKADRLAAVSTVVITPQEYAQRKQPHVIRYFCSLGHNLSEEQAWALVLPSRHRLLKARAGSGKTLTIAAQTALLIEHEPLEPDQILLLAFNKKAAAELQERVQEKFHYHDFRTALTFHSLAYRLVNPLEEIPSSDEEKNLLVEEAMRMAWTPRLRWLADRFFEATDDPEIEAEAAMDSATYLAHRLENVKHLSISGQSVKSKGEKWIADLLFSHDIRFDYERVFHWDGQNYRPDFTIKERDAPNREKVIIEHWGVSKDDPDDAKPFGDDMTAGDYRKQMVEKRKYWKARGTPLIETSVDDMRKGRAAFESLLLNKLKAHGIEATPLDEEELSKRLDKRYWNELSKRMAQFIQRAKNRRKSPAEIKRIWLEVKNAGLRTRIFWRLAARVYAEYEKLLRQKGQMDFQDLLARAAEKIERAGGNLSFVPKHAAPKPGDKAVDLSELRCLLIDEYQDFNPGFDHLIQTMRRYNPQLRLFCVGDDWQAINSFAGSEPIFFRDFVSRLLPEPAAEALLQANYRSHRAVVEVGNVLMKEHGAPSKPTKTEAGQVNGIEIDRLWLESLPSADDNETKGFDNGFMGARCVEMCARLCLSALNAGKSIAILNRTNYIHGMALDDFRKKVIRALGSHWQKTFEPNLRVDTIHKMKGLEADVVILTEIVAGRMPLLHQDIRLYAPFLPPNTDPIEEERMGERRLFYVGLTRARETVWILTEKGMRSEFLKCLPVRWVDAKKIEPLPMPVVHNL